MLQATDFTSQFGAQPTCFLRLGCIGVFVWAGGLDFSSWRPNAVQNAVQLECWGLIFLRSERKWEIKQAVWALIWVCTSRNCNIKHPEDMRFIQTFQTELESEDTSKGLGLFLPCSSLLHQASGSTELSGDDELRCLLLSQRSFFAPMLRTWTRTTPLPAFSNSKLLFWSEWSCWTVDWDSLHFDYGFRVSKTGSIFS